MLNKRGGGILGRWLDYQIWRRRCEQEESEQAEVHDEVRGETVDQDRKRDG
jgi:hypothetical protein